jgi:hypothetical protein
MMLMGFEIGLMKTLFTFLVAHLMLILTCSKWNLERIWITQVITVDVIEVGATSAFLIGDINEGPELVNGIWG